MDHKEWEELIAAALSETGPAQPAAAAESESRAAKIGFVRRLQQLLDSARLEEPPEHVLEAALNIARRPPAAGVIETFLGKLVPRAERGPALAVRGAAATELDPLRFQIGRYDLDLSHLPSGSLLGQVLPTDPSGAELGAGSCYLYGAADVSCADLEEGGEFRFADVSPGRYTLLVEAGELRLVLPEVDLRSPGP